MRKDLRQKGFTLVELAIVMVIIGVMIGGVLKGQSMIENARINRVVSDYKNITAAYFMYYDRYNYFPGDDPTASARWSGISDGDGGGTITGTWSSTTNTDESRIIWQQLRAAEMVSGSGFAQPINTFGGMIGVQGAAYGMTGGVTCLGNILGSRASVIDSKNDDGVANTGTIRGSTAAATYTAGTTYTLCFRI